MTLFPYRAIGIDPGYDKLGWAVGEITGSTLRLIAIGLITTEKASTPDRFQSAREQLADVLKTYTPVVAGIEAVPPGGKSVTFVRLAEMRGIILNEIAQNSIAVREFFPDTVKLWAAGNGHATKAEVELVLRHELKIPPDVRMSDDTSDAVAVLVTVLRNKNLSDKGML